MPPTDLNSYEQWTFVQDWLTAWTQRHLVDGDAAWDHFEAVIEDIQETQPPRP
jgi:hypothetical protein